MQNLTKEVKTGKPLKTVGTVSVPLYENLDELIGEGGETAERILSVFNKGNAVRIMGNERAKHTLGTKMGKNKRFELAYELLPQVVDEETQRACVGDINKLREVCNSPEVQAAVDQFIADNSSGTAEPEAVTEEVPQE